MGMELATTCRDLVVIDYVPELEDVFLDKELERIHLAVKDAFSTVDGLQLGVGKTLSFLSFEHKDLSAILRAKLNELNVMKGVQTINDGQDPVTKATEEDRKPKIEEPKSTQRTHVKDDDLRAKLRENLLKIAFRKLSSHCHPDKTKDENLREIFVHARKYFLDGDLESLQSIGVMVDNYKKTRKSRRSFRDYRREIIRQKKEDLKKAKDALSHIHSTDEHKCYVEATKVGKKARPAYAEYVSKKCLEIDEAIQDIQRQRNQRVQQIFPSTMSHTFYTL